MGGCGYIGSRLYESLSKKYKVDSWDLEWYGNPANIKNKKVDLQHITREDISSYTHVILLAGHSSVKMCENNSLSTIKNNVINFIKILELLTKEQIFIYASSSSVYGDTETRKVNEEYISFRPNNFYDLSKHEVDSYAQLSQKAYFGLRFGTVNGPSPNLRNDIMINAMTYNAIENGKIFCFNPEINRPILGISDLCRAFDVLIEKAKFSNRGIYNLASFNSDVRTIASKVASETGAELEVVDSPPDNITNVKLQSKTYDFLIDSTKFVKKFDFSFEDTVGTIVKSLVDKYHELRKGNRSNAKLY